MTILVWIILFTILAQIQESLTDSIIELPNGKILGRKDVTAENNTYYAFEKIPYAAPPVGDLRFQVPQPVDNWSGILETTNLDVACYQLNNMVKFSPMMNQSEDCLFINVFTPKIPNDSDSELLPVMLFIHGGGFLGGSGANNPPDLFVNKDVILATINYRLGVFGFISTQDDVIPGNNGLKDQLFALKWTKQNIHLFGGDPDRVTIFGQSAGAGSVAHLTLNLDSTGLYQGAILESGTFFCTGMFQRNSRSIAFGTGSVLNSTFASNEDSKALLEFLKSLSAEDLNAAATQYARSITKSYDNFLEVGSIFAPVIEAKNPDAFLTKKMYGLLKAGNAVKVPIMMGFNSEEKLGMINEDAIVSIAQILDENLDYLTPADMQISDLEARKQEGKLIRNIYTGGEPFSDHLGDAIRFSSDNFLSRSMGKHAELYSKISDIFFYEFSYKGSFEPGPILRDNDDDGFSGVSHGAELQYLFCSGSSCNDPSYSEADLVTRERLITLWTNFAKYKNPTPKPVKVFQNVTWPVVSTDNGDFYYVDIGENLEVKNHPKGQAYLKWVELYENLGYDDFDTY